MAKSILRLKALDLRKEGKSVVDISREIGISKSTASVWTREVSLTIKQIEYLKNNSLTGRMKGQIIGSQVLKKRRLALIENYNQLGTQEFPDLTNRELQIAGLCLYWAEGSKKTRKVELCNSDPQMIKFFIYWLQRSYQIPIDELRCYVSINEAHKIRESEVKEYWSQLTNIPLDHFNATSFKKFPLKKVYSNFNHHFGTLVVKVIKPARYHYKILGQIYGLTLIHQDSTIHNSAT
jgi:hypothetical protein